MVWVEDSEELRAADEDHLTHVGRLPTCDVVPHPRAACEEGNHGERAARRPHTHTHTSHAHITLRELFHVPRLHVAVGSHFRSTPSVGLPYPSGEGQEPSGPRTVLHALSPQSPSAFQGTPAAGR